MSVLTTVLCGSLYVTVQEEEFSPHGWLTAPRSLWERGLGRWDKTTRARRERPRQALEGQERTFCPRLGHAVVREEEDYVLQD